MAKSSTLDSTIAQSGATSDTSTVDEIVASVLARTNGTEISHSVITQGDTFIVVEVNYQLPSGEVRTERVRRPL